MKSIIKPGYQDNITSAKQFHCVHCGCVFKASWSDYGVTFYSGEEYYYSECPTCGRDAGEEFNEKNQ